MSKMDGIGEILKRELIRAMLQRNQTMDMSPLMKAVGATEPVKYDDVEETLNIAYVNREEVALAMDVFKPKAPQGTELPVIVVIHGGGLFMGKRDMNRPYSRLLAHKGYLVFSLEYRLAPQATIGQQLDDVCAGMDCVGRMLVSYDVDFSRVFLVADSAGAYLAAYVSAMHESPKLQNAIGYKPSRMVYAAVGFLCGMFYTNKILEDQVFGDKRDDENFKKLMNMEHPEIINNLPPAFLISSCGDSLNNYSLRYNKALKKNGRPSKLLFFGDESLMHVFMITNPEHPKSLEATDKMLAWFEEQADLRRARRKKDPQVEKNRKKLEKRIADGSIGKQKVWANLKERLSVDGAALRRTALIDCTREYTFQQMFDEWDRYARAFSGLGVGCAQNSRVALCGAITAEPLFALYALNMTGAEVSLFSYPDFLPGGMWKEMLEKEKITDLLIADIMVTPELLAELAETRKKLGLRHVILMHSRMGGPAVGPAELVYNEYNYHMLKRRPDVVFLEDLLERYKDAEIRYDESKGDRLAFITHSSGTARGTRKPLPFTDKVFNDTLDLIPEGLRAFMEEDDGKPLRVVQLFDFSSIMALSGQVHSSLAHGDTLVLTFFGFMHPKFIRAVDYYNVSMMFTTGFMVDKWLERTDLDGVDFSSLKIVGMSGGYVSPEKMEAYRAFFRAHNYKYDITAGYGMSEAGGNPLFAPKGSKEDILGYETDPENARIRDENDGKFYRLDEGVRTGVLYKASDARCDNKLDGEVLFEYTRIDGKDFLCTNDLVRVNEDGSLSFAGRADKYFVNNEGKKFDAGVVDTNMAAHRAVKQCAVVPVMDKRIHDTVPVLCVVPAEKGANAAETIREAFIDVYVKEKKIERGNLPTQFVLVDEIPLNANGKLNIFRITRARLGGDAYNLIPVLDGDRLTDIRTEHAEHVNSVTAGTLPAGMENRSAYNIFDLFTAAPSADASHFGPAGLWEMLEPDAGTKKKPFRMPEIPEGVMKVAMKYGNRLSGMMTGRKQINFDFED